MFTASDLVHPFEAGADVPPMPGLVDGQRLDRPDVVAALRRVCGFFGVPEPRVYVSRLPGHAQAPAAIRIAEQSLAELAPDELEALLAHLCGHLMLPGVAGELSADRAAALYHGSADAITRVIFAETAEESETARNERRGAIGSRSTAEESETARNERRGAIGSRSTAEAFRDREERAARTDRHGFTVHSGQSPDDLTVRVREIQAWTATPGFARLALPGHGPSAVLASPV